MPAGLYIDKFGRKFVMMFEAVRLGISHITIAVIFAKNEQPHGRDD